ncbi:hypothetical protein OD218_001795 [Salmonella enterica]|uniref:Eae protein n=2 Tax=Salmonella enterica TaxID=28901 RepID=A0A5V0IIU8_SALER|nr:hypothetical protein [Salmonella enterica]EJQ3402936.1 hypothetical protein [Salmonella enterica]EJX3080138.1 hypothetical protein [Salmonella enterica]EJX3248108.1 hypothetical protein [Salmonella enterica]EJX3458158.1 hypothetical protein [Salmonella enterica]
MQEVKIYTAPPSDLSPPVQSESFCVDMVLASDYAELEEKFMALAAENAALKKSEAEFNEYCRHECEDAGYTWVDDFTETPATYAFLAEMRAQALEQFAVQQESISEKYPAGSYGQESAYDAAQCAREFAEQLRQETAQ